MTYQDERDELVASWLAEGPHHGRPSALNEALAGVRSVRQRPGWLVALTGGTIAQRPAPLLRFAPLLAAVAMVAVIAGAIVAGGLLPTPIVDPSASPDASAPLPSELGLVAYQVTEELEIGEGDCQEGNEANPAVCQVNRIWLANSDGSNAHALHPDAVYRETFMAWSADGAHMVYWTQAGLTIATPSGEVEQLIPRDDLCSEPCSFIGGALYAGDGAITLSPDGTRLAFSRWESTPDSDGSVVAIYDIAAGQSVLLESTRTVNTADCASADITSPDSCQGYYQYPEWSPDSTRLALTRVYDEGPCCSRVYVVNADGSNLQQVTPESVHSFVPMWSPDGSRIAFTGSPNAVAGNSGIYAVSPDGSDLQRLTADEISTTDGDWGRPDWTADGRITFTRFTLDASVGDYVVEGNWVMNADGSNPTPLGTTLAELSAAGCRRCFYSGPAISRAYWQPSATPTPIASPTPIAVEQLPEGTRLEAGQRYTGGLVAPGSDLLAGECADMEVLVDVAFTAGAGWDIFPPTIGSGRCWALGAGDIYGGSRGIAYHPVSSVFVDACDVDGSLSATGPTVDELVSALDQQASTDMSDPVDVTVGGYPGKRFDVTVGGNVPESCNSDGGRQFVWLWPGMSMWVDQADSDTRTVYVIDVEGHRVVFVTSILGPARLHEQAIGEVMASMEFSVR